MLECHGLLCLLYMLLGLLVCEYIQTYSHGLSLAIRVARFSGSSKDLFPLGGVECVRARKSNPVRSLWIRAAPSPCCSRQLLFRCPYLCKGPSMVVIYWFRPLWLMNPFTVVPMFLVRVESAHTRVIPGLVCGRHSSGYSGIQAGCHIDMVSEQPGWL